MRGALVWFGILLACTVTVSAQPPHVVYLPHVRASLTPPDAANVSCTAADMATLCVWVSDATPPQRVTVTVYARLFANGAPVSGQPVRTTWHYKTTVRVADCMTDAVGQASCGRNIGGASIGYTVRVDVTAGQWQASTFFVPE